MAQPLSQVPSEATVSNVAVTTTRSGRIVKKPERYEPVEQVEDDYAPEDYDSDESSDVDSAVSYDESEFSSEDDADDDGNLDGFVVADKSESDDEDSDGPPPVPIKKRPVSRK